MGAAPYPSHPARPSGPPPWPPARSCPIGQGSPAASRAVCWVLLASLPRQSRAACTLPSYEDFQVFTHMASKPTVNKSECCRRFGWSRYQFDLNAFAGMPVVEAARHKGAEWRGRAPARHKGAEWRVDPKAVARWVAERKAEEIARQRRLQEQYAERRREAERKVAAMLARKYDQERARQEAAKRREAEWRAREAKRQMERWLDQAYGHCKRCAYLDIGSPKGANWVHCTPHW